MVEMVAVAAVSLFLVGLVVGLVTTEVLGRSIKQPPSPSPIPQYVKNRSRR